MITSSKEVGSPTKEERDTRDGNKCITKASSSSSPTPWLRLKDPRIVRVSRAFGGKDRHSKVCTIRGLRDRRVRLSVPTAIQLYDLQDRLGLNQPSKVVDWLLDAAKHEIDELPPLPISPLNFSLNHQAMVSSSHETDTSQSTKEGFKTNCSINWEDLGGLSRPNLWGNHSLLRDKSKEVARDFVNVKENWTKENEDEGKQENNEGDSSAQAPSSSSFFHRASHSSSPAGLMNNAMPYGSFFQLEHPNFSFSHLEGHGFAAQTDDLHHNLNSVPLQSTLSLSSGSQILVCPPGTAQPYFHSSYVTASSELDPRQINQFQMSASSTQNLFPNSISPSPYPVNQYPRPLHFSFTPRLFHSHNNSESHPANKDEEFPCK